jgi:hypothetical protein
MLKPQKALRKITTGLSVGIPSGKAPVKKE